MKILVVSDTHGRDDVCLAVIKQRGPFDMFIHCGDLEGSEYTYTLEAGCETHMVVGNNDFFSSLPRETEFMIGSYKAFLTHGHKYHVSFDMDYIKEEAMSRNATIVFYGHTHKPSVRVEGGMYFINPGSISYPRQDGRRQSYIILDINDKQELSYEICYI